MVIRMDYESGEALYVQLRNQIVLAIAREDLREGDSLPPVRQMAQEIGINMHTVNKAYALLREEGLVTIDRRRGAVVCVDADRQEALDELRVRLKVVLAKAAAKGVSARDVHEIVDEIYGERPRGKTDPSDARVIAGERYGGKDIE